MEENLYPVENEEILAEELEEDEGSPVGYYSSLYFDETIGDFARDGQHKLKVSTGVEAWEQWCINCVRTERGAYPAYGDTFGIATHEAFKADSPEEAESILALEINEALMNDPYGRTEFVENIEFNWIDTSQLEVQITVRGIEDVTINVTALIDQRVR